MGRTRPRAFKVVFLLWETTAVEPFLQRVCVCVCTLNRTLPYTVPWYVAGFYCCILVLSAQGWYGTVRYPKQAAMGSTACRAALPSEQALEMKR